MDDSWTLEISPTADGPWLKCPVVDIGPGRTSASPDFYVLAGGPRPLRFDMRYLFEDYRFRCEAVIWRDWFAFGFGGRAYLVSHDLERRIAVDLGFYFEDFMPLDDVLLAVSGQGIVCFRPDGTMGWRNDVLAIDGVTVSDVVDGIISGEGEWDPPGGWRPFRIALADGRALKP